VCAVRVGDELQYNMFLLCDPLRYATLASFQ